MPLLVPPPLLCSALLALVLTGFNAAARAAAVCLPVQLLHVAVDHLDREKLMLPHTSSQVTSATSTPAVVAR